MRGAWIEMAIGIPVMAGVWSLPVRGAWIEIRTLPQPEQLHKPSLPVRGAWIEILPTWQ